mmetsp:Transcript_18599/g.32713  ORF Transcript_18599/g.32713 Transcript_18599/m.32713 type:complete len:91 (+) Transcript_18599:340-612(+)
MVFAANKALVSIRYMPTEICSYFEMGSLNTHTVKAFRLGIFQHQTMQFQAQSQPLCYEDQSRLHTNLTDEESTWIMRHEHDFPSTLGLSK